MNSKTTLEPNAIYSRAETAHLLGISLTTLKQMIRSGHLVVSQPAGIRRVFIKGSSILEMLDRTMLTTQPLTNDLAPRKITTTPIITSRFRGRSPSIDNLDIGNQHTTWNRDDLIVHSASRHQKEIRARPRLRQEKRTSPTH